MTTAQPWRVGILVLVGVLAGAFFCWQFRTDSIWVGLPFGILGGSAAGHATLSR